MFGPEPVVVVRIAVSDVVGAVEHRHLPHFDLRQRLGVAQQSLPGGPGSYGAIRHKRLPGSGPPWTPTVDPPELDPPSAASLPDPPTSVVEYRSDTGCYPAFVRKHEMPSVLAPGRWCARSASNSTAASASLANPAALQAGSFTMPSPAFEHRRPIARSNAVPLTVE